PGAATKRGHAGSGERLMPKQRPVRVTVQANRKASAVGGIHMMHPPGESSIAWPSLYHMSEERSVVYRWLNQLICYIRSRPGVASRSAALPALRPRAAPARVAFRSD